MALCIFIISAGLAQAHKGGYKWECTWDCTPTPTLFVTPTLEPSGEPTVTPTEPMATPSAEVTPEVTSTPSTDTSVVNDTTEAPAAVTCTISFTPALVQGFHIDGATQTYSWWKSPDSIDQAVVYGYYPGDERFGLVHLGTERTSLTIKGLDMTKTSWFQVWSENSQGCWNKSNWFN